MHDAEVESEFVQVRRARRVDQVVISKYKISSRCALTDLNSVGTGVFTQPLLLLKMHYVPDHPGTGFERDPRWFSVQLALQWKEKYSEEHGMECNNPLQVLQLRPFWVVDVERECIVSGQHCGTFVALSYRWGTHSWSVVSKKVLAILRKPVALTRRV